MFGDWEAIYDKSVKNNSFWKSSLTNPYLNNCVSFDEKLYIRFSQYTITDQLFIQSVALHFFQFKFHSSFYQQFFTH